MKERPILFNSHMVRAILEGKKNQTRRIVKEPYELPTGDVATKQPCPYGQAGDRLWVRETFFESGVDYRDEAYPDGPECAAWIPNGRIHYAADGSPVTSKENKCWRKKPSIFMPRKHSRISLEIENVSIQCLQDITEVDAENEGVDFLRQIPDADETLTARELFEILWDSINKKRGFGWDANPFVWVVKFKRI